MFYIIINLITIYNYKRKLMAARKLLNLKKYITITGGFIMKIYEINMDRNSLVLNRYSKAISIQQYIN